MTIEHEHVVTDIEKTFAFLSHLSIELHDLKIHLSDTALDVDEFSLPGNAATQTVYTVQKNYYLPIVVDYILATFPPASTSVTLQLGNRIIPILDLAAGQFTADVKMQLEWDDIRSLTIAPAGAAYLEIMGHASRKEYDRP